MRFVKLAKPKEDTAVYDFILKKEAEGKSLRVAKIAALNKFLRIYYARVKAYPVLRSKEEPRLEICRSVPVNVPD